ncbi:DNA glycosylase AlkZ-like family protein [Actinacidiphila acidipaludis]|uniref:Winged helix DNA-binding domain-containing protein n=1 Tax=Actinacidiphila acidipaludis TaxID=2873382 RepID=A0ABS7QDA4_9ACTN|nr:crosslink repair DNA glycosylase YcaQ family protein [Streptomyces acidipaludis]MBY8881150.1 winged helix DNA-binding domain-containing protein [Streptomyces acidipaludis]
MAALSGDEVRRLRARAQGLYGPGGRTVTDAVRLAAGLQAQDVKACRLQVRARSQGLTAADVDAACAAGPPSVVRTWLMRGTLHAVAAADVRWLTALLGPRVADRYRGRRARLGLDDELCARALGALERVLPGRALRRDELVARLAEEGVALDPRSQAPAHLLLYAAARGVVCRGPEAEGDAATYVLTAEWLKGVADADLSGDDAAAEIAVRHAASYGPVTAADLARWSGLPLGQARRAQAAAGSRLTSVTGPDGPLVVASGVEAAAAQSGGGGGTGARGDGGGAGATGGTGAGAAAGSGGQETGAVRLTGHFDPYLLGYRDRDLMLPPAFAARIATGGGFLMPCVLRDGAVVATWRRADARGTTGFAVRVESLTGERDRALRDGIDAAVADIGRFLGISADWEWATGL